MIWKIKAPLKSKKEYLNINYKIWLQFKIKEIKAKNGILMDKILSVHNLIEKISIKYNQFERNTNDEVK